MRKEFQDVTKKILNDNFNSALLLGDISVFGFQSVINSFPDRVINLGILEQSIVGIAAGYSSKGITPFIHTIAPFLVERAYEQIKIDFGYQNLPGNIVSVGASFDYSTLGCTHHCPADIQLMSQIPRIKLFIPGHGQELSEMIKMYWNSGNLNYFRLSEIVNAESVFVNSSELFKIKEGSKALIIAVGNSLRAVIEAMQSQDVDIYYLNSIDTSKGINIEPIKKHKNVVIVEPYYSGVVLNHLTGVLELGVKILQIGIKREFIDKYGSRLELQKYVGLDAESIYKKIMSFLNF